MLAFGSCRAEERLRCAILNTELRTECFGAQGEVTAGDLRRSNSFADRLELGGGEGIDRIHGEDTPREGGFGERIGRIEMAIGVESFEMVDRSDTSEEPRLHQRSVGLEEVGSWLCGVAEDSTFLLSEGFRKDKGRGGMRRM